MCVAMDTAETRIYVGAMDGNIYSIDLFSVRSLTEKNLSSQVPSIFKGHSKPITTLATSMDGTLLISGFINFF